MIGQPLHHEQIASLGVKNLIKYFEAGNRYDPLIPIIPKGIKYPVYVRRGTTDIYNYLQVFEEHEYSSLPSNPKTIIDLGAYVGYTAVLFATKHEPDIIISVEPESSNYAMLLLNTLPYNSIKCVHAGIWSNNCQLSITDKIGGDWGTIVNESQEDSIDFINGITINDLVTSYGLDSIDFLKVDIEGSEKPLFDNCESWINLVKMVCCETHDRFVEGCAESYHNAFKNKSYSSTIINQSHFYFDVEYVSR